MCHLSLAFSLSDRKLNYVLQELRTLRKIREENSSKTVVAMGDFNILPHYSETLKQIEDGDKYLEDQKWLSGFYMQPDFRTLPGDKVPLSEQQSVPTSASPRYLFNLDENTDRTSVCSTLGFTSTSADLIEMWLPIPEVFPSAKDLTPKQCCELFEEHKYDSGENLLFDHFPALINIPM